VDVKCFYSALVVVLVNLCTVGFCELFHA